MTDPTFYPHTDRTDWEPLMTALESGKLIGRYFCEADFMFMQADLLGRRYYKHHLTRRYLILDQYGTAFNACGMEITLAHALENCLPPQPHDVYDTFAEAIAANGTAHGVERIILSTAQIAALLDRKVVAVEINGGEYQGYIAIDEALLPRE